MPQKCNFKENMVSISHKEKNSHPKANKKKPLDSIIIKKKKQENLKEQAIMH